MQMGVQRDVVPSSCSISTTLAWSIMTGDSPPLKPSWRMLMTMPSRHSFRPVFRRGARCRPALLAIAARYVY